MEHPPHDPGPVLAFFFGYALTLLPLRRAGVALGAAIGLAFASDTAAITIMQIVDNATMLAIPGARESGLDSPCSGEVFSSRYSLPAQRHTR